MRVVVPYTDLRPETASALAASGTAYQAVRMREDCDYWNLLANLWSKGETFAIVEQDIVISADTLPALAACGNDWCAFPYGYCNLDTYCGLGCTKFGSQLLARVPDALDRVAGMCDATHPPKHWCRLDAWLTETLTGDGERRCEHRPPVQHLHRFASHGCVPIPEQ